MLLDTRAYVLLRRGELDLALKDVDLAILQTRQYVAQDGLEQRVKAVDERDFARRVKAVRQSLAVILYHRSLIYAAKAEKANEEDRANFEASGALDRAEIRNLGFVPDERLM